MSSHSRFLAIAATVLVSLGLSSALSAFARDAKDSPPSSYSYFTDGLDVLSKMMTGAGGLFDKLKRIADQDRRELLAQKLRSVAQALDDMKESKRDFTRELKEETNRETVESGAAGAAADGMETFAGKLDESIDALKLALKDFSPYLDDKTVLDDLRSGLSGKRAYADQVRNGIFCAPTTGPMKCKPQNVDAIVAEGAASMARLTKLRDETIAVAKELESARSH